MTKAERSQTEENVTEYKYNELLIVEKYSFFEYAVGVSSYNMVTPHCGTVASNYTCNLWKQDQQ